MSLFQAAKETGNKLRWAAVVDGTTFSLYIPKWRIPVPWPGRIWVSVFPRRAESADSPNVTFADVQRDGTITLEPIIATVEKHDEKTKTIRYRPTGDGKAWEIGEPYIPFALSHEGAERLRLTVLRDLTSRGMFPIQVEAGK